LGDEDLDKEIGNLEFGHAEATAFSRNGKASRLEALSNFTVSLKNTA